MKIGELSRRSGASARSIRHYEKSGRLVSSRQSNGYRHFGPEAVSRIQYIVRMIGLGFSLEEIATFSPCMFTPEAKGICPDARAVHQENRVPFFRNEQLELLEHPFHVSLVTALAPNAGEALRRDPSIGPRFREVLYARAFKVLQVAAHRGHRTLVLGAWGCGVFRNDPTEVAKAFSAALGALPGAFARVVFAVYERGGDGPNLRAFRDRFGPHSA